MTDRDTGYDAAEVARVVRLLDAGSIPVRIVSRMGWPVRLDRPYNSSYRDFADALARVLRSCMAEVERLRARQMPDGVEWPRFEDGEPVRIGDYIEHEGETEMVLAVCLYDGVSALSLAGCHNDPTHWVERGGVARRPPICGKDGHPVEVGQTVYGGDGRAWEVTGLDHARLGHRPEYNVHAVAADGSGDRRELKAGWLTHESPDSWERLEADAETIRRDIAKHLGDYSPSNFEDGADSVQERLTALVGRAKALAGCEAS